MPIHLLLLGILASAVSAEPLDRIAFGDAASEASHAFSSTGSVRTEAGADGFPARALLPLHDEGWQGGAMRCEMSVDPAKTNLVTAKFWGGEANGSLLFLFCEGKQIGYRPLGDYDLLCGGSGSPPLPGRFFYVTTPLPFALTKGHERVTLEVHVTGGIWRYGTSFAIYQRKMERQSRSRAVYQLCTHTDSAFVPDGTIPSPSPAPVRPAKDIAPLLEQAKARVNRDALAALRQKRGTCSQMQVHLLARCFRKPWSPLHGDTNVLSQIVACVDRHAERQLADPTFAAKDPSTWNPGWFGFGPLGDSVRILFPELVPYLTPERRKAWAGLFASSVQYLRTHRREYTNQSMIIDMNLYRSNRALELLDPEQALDEKAALEYLYEAVGLSPWLGPDDAAGNRTCPVGRDYRQLTALGLSRELGYVGGYGEMTDWMCGIYEATLPVGKTDGAGDVRLKAQLAKAVRARAPFRYPAVIEGFRAMQLESAVGWRDTALDPEVIYGTHFGREATSLHAAVLTGDEAAMGYAQQELADNQFAPMLETHLSDGGLRGTLGLVDAAEDFAAMRKADASLPMTTGQPDYLFADADDAVIALKRGGTILYASLYWRARFGINHLAKVHLITPGYEVRATVPCEAFFNPSGRVYKRPASTDAGYGHGAFHEYDAIPSAHAGEELPVARMPEGAAYNPKTWNTFAGAAFAYRLEYGPYLIIVNRGPKPFDSRLPSGAWRSFPDGKPLSGAVSLAPGQCLVAVRP